MEQKLEGVESVRVELGKEEVVRVGMGVLLFWKKEYQVHYVCACTYMRIQLGTKPPCEQMHIK